VFLYDNYPGGIGIAAPLHGIRDQVLVRAVDLVAHCPCEHGCPACVGPVLADPRQAHTPKQAALAVLRLFQSGADAGEQRH
jgi:DEAD/DEAH box helicase domain-containing protein